MPAPVFARVALVPEITPERVPVPDETSTVPVPDAAIAIVFVGAIEEPRARVVPELIVKSPVPIAELLAKERVPVDKVVPPE